MNDRKEYFKEYRETHRDERRAYQKEYQQRPEVKEMVRARMRIYLSKPEVKAHRKAYYETPKMKAWREEWEKEYSQRPERMAKRREEAMQYFYENREAQLVRHRIWMKKNWEYNLEYIRNQRKENIQFCIKERLKASLHNALNRYGNGKIQSSRKYGIDWTPIIEKLITTKPADFNEKAYHIDHIQPVSSFDLTDTEQIKQAFSPDNLQWLTAEENISKGDKYES
jgi:hypothetical protein